MNENILLRKPYKTREKVGNVKVGGFYMCELGLPWVSPVRGECLRIYENSALINIYSTSERDDLIARDHKFRVIAPLKKMIPMEEW